MPWLRSRQTEPTGASPSIPPWSHVICASRRQSPCTSAACTTRQQIYTAAGRLEPAKIGVAGDAEKRLRELQVGSPVELIRVYEEHDMWHVDYGESETEDHSSREEAEAAADAVAQAEERTVVVEE